MGFYRHEYWCGLPFPSPGDLPNPGIEPRSPASQADSLPTELQGKPQTQTTATKSLQLCPILCDPIDSSPPGSPVPGILQARTLEWVDIFVYNAWKWKVKVKLLSRVQLSATPWTAAFQALPSMGFSRQEYWGGVPLPSPKHRLKGHKNKYLFQVFLSLHLFSLLSLPSSIWHTHLHI